MIDLTGATERCCADNHGCTILTDAKVCNWECPFYKPKNCKDWVRLETNGRVLLYAPEELQGV